MIADKSFSEHDISSDKLHVMPTSRLTAIGLASQLRLHPNSTTQRSQACSLCCASSLWTAFKLHAPILTFVFMRNYVIAFRFGL